MSTQLLVVGWVWPEPEASAAGGNMLSLLKEFLSEGWTVTFASSAEVTPLSYPLADLGIHCQAIAVNDSRFDEWVKTLAPDAVLFDRFLMEEQFGWRVAEACPEALRVIDTEDLQCLRQARQQAFKDGAVFSKDYLNSDLSKREIAAIWRSDLSLIISSIEYDLLRSHFQVPAELLFYRPLALEEIQHSPVAEASLSFAERHGFATIGNFRHPPNWDAVLYLKQIWPQVRARLPEAELHIYGAYLPPKARQLHNPKQGFHVDGWVESAGCALAKARVSVAPLRYGAGQKGKLLLSMCAGTPSVTTGVGAESMVSGQSWPGKIADSIDDFVAAMVQLHEEESAWQAAQSLGWQWLETLREQQQSGQLVAHIRDIQQNLKAHRSANFIGGMLNYHHHQSTKYMSQWIEAKSQHSKKNGD